MTISEFIQRVSANVAVSVQIRYLHPTLFIFCTSDSFRDLTAEARRQRFSEMTAVAEADVATITTNPTIELILATSEEVESEYGFVDPLNADTSWLSAFSPVSVKGDHAALPAAALPAALKGPVRAVHFYGYKGGQGRSTVLLSVAKTLADSGYRVLLVDADLEAPSLDAMLKVAAQDTGATIMGLASPGVQLTPLVNTYVGEPMRGSLDLVAARPASARYDMDFAAFLLNASLDTAVLRRAIEELRRQVNAEDSLQYDVVLFDHRTGLAPSVLPIMDAWPGPAVIFVRPDGMAPHIQHSQLIDRLLGHDPESPGAFVSFSLNPKLTAADARVTHAKEIDAFLEKIANAIDDDAFFDPQELEPYWVFWRHDQNLVDGRQPLPRDMLPENRAAVGQLRSVLGLSGTRESSMLHTANLTSSGNTDEGQFILTPWLAKLFSVDSPYSYIFGRKGTGKTRLAKELVQRDLAEPLLMAKDANVGGLVSAGRAFDRAFAASDKDSEQFWWLLLRAALSVDSTRDSEALEGAIDEQLQRLAMSQTAILPNDLREFHVSDQKRVFVIDGVETAVPAANLRTFVEGLFRFLSAVQYDRLLSKNLTIRLLLRTDMAVGASENVEQQIEGSVIFLHWNKTAILNFALSRIVNLEWFTNHFATVCKTINSRFGSISRGALPDDEAEGLLLEIFPQGLARNRLKTTTFFATYFSDAGSELGNDSAFYPRLFDGFLRTLARNCSDAATGNIVDGRLSSDSVLEAYDQASRDFINDVRTELYSFLNLAVDRDENKRLVDRLMAAFQGLATPFPAERMVVQLKNKVADLSETVIRQSLNDMTKIGIFEHRTGYPGELRARQLYKAGLGMKYVRKKKTSDSDAEFDDIN